MLSFLKLKVGKSLCKQVETKKRVDFVVEENIDIVQTLKNEVKINIYKIKIKWEIKLCNFTHKQKVRVHSFMYNALTYGNK